MPAVTIISELPRFISPEEHRHAISSTPESFSDIPPVVRHKQENVSITFDPVVEGLGMNDLADGTLYVIESSLVYFSNTGRGFKVDYPSITLHAISRAETGPSIYCQLDEPASDEQENEDEEVSNMSELIIVPRDAASLESIFEALSQCASLHPDPNDEMDGDEDAFLDADAFEAFQGDEGEELSEVGKAALAHLESIIYNPFEQPKEATEDAGSHDVEVTEQKRMQQADITEKQDENKDTR